MRGSLRQLAALAAKDLRLEARDPTILYIQAVLSLSLAVVVGMLSRSSPWSPETLLPPSVAAVLLFHGVFAAYTSFAREEEAGTIDSLRLSPLDPGLLFLEKSFMSSVWIATFTLVYLAAYQLLAQPLAPWQLAAATYWIVAASVMMGSVASLTSALMLYSGARTALTPTIIAVLSAPYLGSASSYLSMLASGLNPPPGWEAQVLAAPLMFTGLSAALARAVV